jgi:hypothetical protein
LLALHPGGQELCGGFFKRAHGGDLLEMQLNTEYPLDFSSVRLKSEQIQLVRAERCFRDFGIGLQGA